MINNQFSLIGSDYGGWMINESLIPQNSTIISAGVGEDISFDLYFIKNKKCNIIGIDPTYKSHIFIENYKELQNFHLIKKALTSKPNDVIRIYKNTNTNHVSESILESHSSVKKHDYYLSDTIDLHTLFEMYDNISVVKMDIEGSEYDVMQNVKYIPESVKQFCIEFHHFCTDKTIDDTKNIINIMQTFGFFNYIEKPSTKLLNEITFWRQ